MNDNDRFLKICKILLKLIEDKPITAQNILTIKSIINDINKEEKECMK